MEVHICLLPPAEKWRAGRKRLTREAVDTRLVVQLPRALRNALLLADCRSWRPFAEPPVSFPRQECLHVRAESKGLDPCLCQQDQAISANAQLAVDGQSAHTANQPK